MRQSQYGVQIKKVIAKQNKKKEVNLLKWDERLMFLMEEDKYLRINHLFSNVASHVIFRDDNSFLKQNVAFVFEG